MQSAPYEVRAMNIVTLPIYVAAVGGLLLYIWLKSLRLQIRQPPPNYLQICVESHKTGAPLPPALKTPAVRRQLILASKKPAALTNLLPMDTKTLNLEKGVKKNRIFGFFHPNADAGGGGERVLWAAVLEVLRLSPQNVCCVYVTAKPETTPAALVKAAETRFNIQFTPDQTDRIVVIALKSSWMIDPLSFPLLTLLGQAIGMAVLGYEAISNLLPDVFIDTTGLAFSYPVVRFFAQIPIVAYVHYPFIQQEMINTIKGNFAKKIGKYFYYKFLQTLYNFAGSFASVVMCNGTWTQKNLSFKSTKEIVYPPCAVQDFPKPTNEKRSNAIVYLAQFRPEKRHDLVINSFAKFLKLNKKDNPHLILIGSVRDQNDLDRVNMLNSLALNLGLSDRDYTIVKNAPWDAVKRILNSSLIGLNAMWNEHFGMGVVEVMAAGLIPVVHASAGPLLDIVKDDLGAPGFFFESAADPDFTSRKYMKMSECFAEVFKLSDAEQAELRMRAYNASQRFSDAAFSEKFGKFVEVAAGEVGLYEKRRLAMGLYD